MIGLVNTLLTVYTGVMVGLLLLFLGAIARFYARQAQQRSLHGLFIVPVICLGAATLRYALLSALVGDMWGDLARFIGGVWLMGLGLFLLSRMVVK